MECQWDKSWTPVDYLEPCTWVQCINPPDPPPGTNLVSLWDEAPVGFFNSSDYACFEEDFYFEMGREVRYKREIEQPKPSPAQSYPYSMTARVSTILLCLSHSISFSISHTNSLYPTLPCTNLLMGKFGVFTTYND